VPAVSIRNRRHYDSYSNLVDTRDRERFVNLQPSHLREWPNRINKTLIYLQNQRLRGQQPEPEEADRPGRFNRAQHQYTISSSDKRYGQTYACYVTTFYCY
jgi:hypothetical protein